MKFKEEKIDDFLENFDGGFRTAFGFGFCDLFPHFRTRVRISVLSEEIKNQAENANEREEREGFHFTTKPDTGIRLKIRKVGEKLRDDFPFG